MKVGEPQSQHRADPARYRTALPTRRPKLPRERFSPLTPCGRRRDGLPMPGHLSLGRWHPAEGPFMARERIQRRLAAILAADVVGYSRLMEADEGGTLAALRAHRKELIDPKIAEHGGRIVKLMGDGALVEFASVVDAVECAVAIQRAIAELSAGNPEDRRIAFRIGINVGDIIIEGADIHGDGVNVAARLEGIAEPGGITISEDAWRQVQG